MSGSIIVDTDIDTDCDDAGALAVLHNLAQAGEANIAGIVCSIPYAPTADCVRAINAYYGRPEIPVGLLGDESLEASPRFAVYREHLASAEVQGWRRYNEVVGTELADLVEGTPPPSEAVPLYRRLLSERPDDSVVIVAIGLLTALEKLLESGADEQSSLSGVELVERKVHKLVTMGLGSFPAGEDVFNWKMDRQAAAVVLNRWPGTVAVSEWGTTVLTGAGLSSRCNSRNPVRRAYEVYLGGAGRQRPSWDQVAMLYAVRGAGDLFEERSGYSLHFDPSSGRHRWIGSDSEDRARVYLKQVASDEEFARRVEDLMVHEPEDRSSNR